MPTEKIEALSKQISELQSGIETVSTGATWGLIIACAAFLLILMTIIVLLFSRSKVSRRDQSRDTIREYLAIGIVIVGICIVGILGVVAMVIDDEHFRREALAGILPLIGAWVGAVIAYYFGKENFQAASDSTAKLLSRDERLAKTPISKVMIPIAQVKGVIRVADLDEAKKQKIKDFTANMPYNRAPVLTNSDFPLLVIHKSTFHEYLAKDATHQTHTLEDVCTNAKDLWTKINAFGTIKPGTTAAEVKQVMQNVGPDCSDVYITEDGTKTSAAIGLITNVDLLKADYL